ncbi:hypothetical protein ACIA47_00550 [Micromonospora sp. NPDC051227]|uniref:hypothetical protein n=1 Tax=Micromonospora sp. NPDC051227 TaxID=3364285 RepID=UPI00193283AC|nr:hypothetical protein [Micromonospora sp. STR1s_5]
MSRSYVPLLESCIPPASLLIAYAFAAGGAYLLAFGSIAMYVATRRMIRAMLR